MISENFEFADFVKAIRDKSHLEVIQLADMEATKAERIFLGAGKINAVKRHSSKAYAERLKRLISYMRCELKPRSRYEEDAALFSSLIPDHRLYPRV